jgi:hypothetical protein
MDENQIQKLLQKLDGEPPPRLIMRLAFATHSATISEEGAKSWQARTTRSTFKTLL